MRRVLTSLVLIPLVIYLVLFANWWLLAAAIALVACTCYYEYRKLAAAYGLGTPSVLGYAVGLVILFVNGNTWPWLVLVLAGLIALTLAMREQDLRLSLPRAALLECAQGLRAGACVMIEVIMYIGSPCRAQRCS